MNRTLHGSIYLPGLETHKQNVMSLSALQFRMEINRVSVGQKKREFRVGGVH